jgi:hypothetical protein
MSPETPKDDPRQRTESHLSSKRMSLGKVTARRSSILRFGRTILKNVRAAIRIA